MMSKITKMLSLLALSFLFLTTPVFADYTTWLWTGQNGAELKNSTNNVVTLTENSEDIIYTFGTNAIVATSSTGVTSLTFTDIDLTISGGTITGITDIVVADGGTGASSFTDGGILLGSDTGALTAMAVLADGSIVVGDGTTDPVALAVFDSSTGDVIVAAGGTGLSALTAHKLIVGNGTTAVNLIDLGTNGQMLLGQTGADPSFQTMDTDATMDETGTVTIADEAISYAKMQHISATDIILGRSTGGAGDVEEIACTSAGRALLDDAAASDQRTTLGVDVAGTDNSVAVTLDASATTGGLSLSTQAISHRASTNAQTGYATAAQITALEANTAALTVNPTVADSTDARVIDSADYGKTIFFTYAGAVAVTLPANGAAIGSWFICVNANSDTTDPTYTATSDTLIAPNDAQADSVNFATGHRIGSCVKFISNGSYWLVINLSTACQMDITT